MLLWICNEYLLLMYQIHFHMGIYIGGEFAHAKFATANWNTLPRAERKHHALWLRSDNIAWTHDLLRKKSQVLRHVAMLQTCYRLSNKDIHLWQIVNPQSNIKLSRKWLCQYILTSPPLWCNVNPREGKNSYCLLCLYLQCLLQLQSTWFTWVLSQFSTTWHCREQLYWFWWIHTQQIMGNELATSAVWFPDHTSIKLLIVPSLCCVWWNEDCHT